MNWLSFAAVVISLVALAVSAANFLVQWHRGRRHLKLDCYLDEDPERPGLEYLVVRATNDRNAPDRLVALGFYRGRHEFDWMTWTTPKFLAPGEAHVVGNDADELYENFPDIGRTIFDGIVDGTFARTAAESSRYTGKIPSDIAERIHSYFARLGEQTRESRAKSGRQ